MTYFPHLGVDGIQEMLRRPLEHGLDRCMSCGGVPVVGAVLFTPEENFAQRIGQPKNKRRVAVYALCQPCVDDDDRSTRRAEARILCEAGIAMRQ